MKNCPVNRESANNAIRIWGPSTANLKGKTTRSHNEPVVINNEMIHPVPHDIMKLHSNITIGMDVMKVNGVPLLVTISTVLHYAALFELKDMSMPQ